MMMDVEIVKSSKDWDNVLDLSPHTRIFHTWRWLKTMEKHSKKKIMGKRCRAKLYPLVILDGDDAVGVFPVYHYRGPVSFALSPPSGVEDLYLGPLILNYDSLKQSKRESRFFSMVREVDMFIKDEMSPNFILFHTPPNLLDTRPFKWLGYDVEPRYTYVLHLTTIDEVWKNFHRSLRRGIEKARKNGITVRMGDKEDVEHIYNLLRRRNRIHTTKDFILEIYEKFYPKNVRVFIAEVDGERLSGIVNICYRDKVCFWIGAPKYTSNGINPNELVFYESIRWAVENGYRYYEVMGADDFTLYDFKRKFNGNLTMYFTVRRYRPSLIKVIEAIYRCIRPRYR